LRRQAAARGLDEQLWLTDGHRGQEVSDRTNDRKEIAPMSKGHIALLASIALLVSIGFAVGSGVAATAKKRTPPTKITVKAKEFHFTLSRRSIAKPGAVKFIVKNVGKEAHNFVMLSGINKTTPLIQPHHSATLEVTFKKKGAYTYECSVGEHAEEGMIGKFVVK
jgi:plastocyanin